MPGKKWSGLRVASTIASTDDGSSPASSRAITLARRAISAPVIPSGTHRRSRMPVRSTIHSSLVSISRVRSSFVTTRSGT